VTGSLMLSVAEARALIVQAFKPLAVEQVSLSEGFGRVLAADVSSRITQPFAAVSAMDGYAVRAGDVATCPATLDVIGESAAGKGFAGSIGAGQAVRIFTGAPVPAGADTIVIQENTTAKGNRVEICEGAAAGRFVRRAGLDFKTGDVLLKAGRVLSARDIGMAAAMNVPWLAVRRRPRIAILATGNEIVMPGEPVGPDQITSSNSLALAAYVRAMGGEPVNLGIARDTHESLARHIGWAIGADALVTIGGASVGDHDLVGEALKTAGMELGFYRIAMRPGKPLIFGRLGAMPVLGLPGNPVSVGVTTLMFLQPAMNAMLGIPGTAPVVESAILGCDLGQNDRREDYLRASLSTDDEGRTVATPFAAQDSSMMALFARADCLVVRPPHAPPARAGERIAMIRPPHGFLSF